MENENKENNSQKKKEIKLEIDTIILKSSLSKKEQEVKTPNVSSKRVRELEK